MKLIIDIDEDTYKARQHWVANQKRMVDEVDIAIANGIPLDEIRTEIEMEKLEDSPNFCIKAHNIAVDRVLGIIDKYKAETEDKE